LAADAEPSFVEEMRRLGVSPQVEPEIAPPAAADSQPESRAPAADSGPVTEEQLFIRALGRLETTFHDDYDLAQSPPAASPRRMKQLRQGTLQPEARLDLHGLTRDEVRSRVRFFLEDAAHHRKKVVLIITGWGKNSTAEPVLRLEVERYLALDAKAWVVEWARAPRHLGGEGALVVFLKGS
jgi:DNA-nicking Smr family endonuclease